MEDEREVQQKLADVYAALLKQEEDEIDWEAANQDLALLSWLDADDDLDLLKATWTVLDKWASALIEGMSRANVLKVSQVQEYVSGRLSVLTSKSENDLLVSEVCRSHLNSLNFFRASKNIMKASAHHGGFGEIVDTVVVTYKEMKAQCLVLFADLNKLCKRLLLMSLSDLLDDMFSTFVIEPLRTDLMKDPLTAYIVNDFSAVNNSFEEEEHTYSGQLNDEQQRSGFGCIDYSNGDRFEGFWEHDKPNGKGLYLWRGGGCYEGEFVHGEMTGHGRRIYLSGNVYEGNFVGNKKCGEGSMQFANGDVYEGNWLEDEMAGAGKYTWSSGDFFVGMFKTDKRQGQGCLTLTDGQIIEGVWKDDELEAD